MDIFSRRQRLFFPQHLSSPAHGALGSVKNDVICQRKDGEIGGQIKDLLLTYETYNVYHMDPMGI